ncbi:arsenic metallochaperone ArsD family protein [Cohnella nanjingensis]|uniref:Arsenic metallochaperone ArsD family protein n=1 Tax=Cohnella nanjingensis TaxID=1387779 RepID=A0A7X0VCX7_9BACL|nr:arsenic metallochaperone ArsD family protein [Cohnella nanjingensis]MBB6669370.1 arsenic metallochaperone ArsD family protein [Cohnella nanjingensis]
MIKIEVFEAGSCCSAGVTNPAQKRDSIRFAAAINQLTLRGIDIYRYNILSDTAKFEAADAVMAVLTKDPNSMPITVVDGIVAKTHQLPGNDELSKWTNQPLEQGEGKQKIQLQIKK